MKKFFFLLFAACVPENDAMVSATDTSSSSTTGNPVPTTSGTTSDTSISSGIIEPFCGDGIVQDSEECDDGNKNNNDSCIFDCKLAFCGDGEVFIGTEQCDEFSLDSVSCDLDCTFPICGDGYSNHSAGEQCDSEENCNNECKWSGTLIFLTSSVFNPAIGGTKNADIECQKLANKANLEGSYRAWLWTSIGGPGVDWPELKPPYVMTNGEIIADTWEQFYLGTWHTVIDITENGIFFKDEDGDGLFSSAAWVGYHPEGVQSWPEDENCIDWTNNLALGGAQGLQEFELQWNGLGGAWGLSCLTNELHFICAQIGETRK